MAIWTDSSYAASGLHRLLVDPADVPDSSNCELWIRLQQALAGCEAPVLVRHIASHRGVVLHVNDVDEWTAMWNERADREACRAHAKRDAQLKQVWTSLVAHHEKTEELLSDLQALHWESAENFVLQNAEYKEAEEDNDNDIHDEGNSLPSINIRGEAVLWFDSLPENWGMMIHGTVFQSRLGDQFTRECITMLLDQHCSD